MMSDPCADDGKTRILAFTPSLGGGGAEMHLLRLINHLDRDRFRLSVAVGRGGGDYEENLAEDVEHHVLREGPFVSSTLRLIRSIRPLRRLMREKRPDIVFSVMDHANVAALLAARPLHETPCMVIGVQNTPSMKYRKGWRNPVQQSIFTFMSVLYPRADHIVPLSRGVAGDLAASLPALREEATTVIYNAGVSDPLLEKAAQPPPDEVPREEPLIVACGRMTEQKGFSYLLESFAHVRRHVPARLWIIGEGEERGALKTQARRLGVSDYLWMPGFKKNPYRYMAAADVFALSSLWEGFGNVVVEAMACGAPVVATDCPHGPAEIIDEGNSGLLVPPADAQALADALLRVLRDSSMRDRLSRSGRKRAEDFHAAAAAEQYGRLFQREARGENPKVATS